MADIIERDEATVVPARRPRRSRLPGPLKVAILFVLNLGINSLLWQAASNFLPPELGFVSKVPTEEDKFSLTGPVARLAFKVVTLYATWAVGYDHYDVSALTLLTNAPYAYLLSTYYQISTLTVAAHMNIEILSIAIPTFFLRDRAPAHRPNVPLRNRFLLNSVQVQLSNAALAIAVYSVIIWGGIKIGFINSFLVTYFDIPTLEAAHLETPVTVGAKIFTVGFAAKEFLLNPSIAAQVSSGQSTPVANFDATTADLQSHLRHNFWFFGRRTRTLIQQTWILCFFTVANTIQRCMTLNGAEFTGAAGYAGIWAIGNAVVAAWFAWVGDTSTDYVVN